MAENKPHAKEYFVGSDLSERYFKYRPKLPLEHVKTIVGRLGRRPEFWLDVGCGPGTSTQQIVGHADRILGVDVSQTQVDVANRTLKQESLSFVQGSCEKLPAEDCSVDVVTVVQAVHYFDLPAFFEEVDRVLKPGGILGLVSFSIGPFCVDSPTLKQAANCITDLFIQSVLPEQAKLLSESYKNMELPYPDRRDDQVAMVTSWSLQDYLEVCMTFSQVNNKIRALGLSVEEGYGHVTQMLREGGMTEEDVKSVYTWSQPAVLVSARKPKV